MQQKKIIFIISGIFLISALMTGVLFFYTYTVSGKITDLTNKEPISDVKVSINGLIDKTDTDGLFEIKNIKLYQKGLLQLETTKEYEEKGLVSLDYSKRNITCNIEFEPTLEVMVNRINSAIRNVQHDYSWDYMHPDDQQYWESKNDYIKIFEKLSDISAKFGRSAPEHKIEQNIIKLEFWKHEITAKEYTNVMEVPVEVKIIYEGKEQTQINLTHWQKINGVWRYFTKTDKEESKEAIKVIETYKEIDRYKELKEAIEAYKELKGTFLE